MCIIKSGLKPVMNGKRCSEYGMATLLWFSKVLRKSKLSEPHTRAQRIYKNGSTTTKNKPYFVRLVGKLVK